MTPACNKDTFANIIAYAFIMLLFMLGATSIADTTRVISYSYDTSDQLTKAVLGNNTTVEYVYDDMGNRLMMTASLTNITSNSPPYAAYTPSPLNNATGIKLGNTPLGWECDGDPDGDTVVYTVFFDTYSTNLPPVWSGFAKTYHKISQNMPASRYYWKVKSTDAHNNVTEGPVWSFDALETVTPESQISYPATGAELGGTFAQMSGIAWDTGGSGVASVEISFDGGQSWDTATGTENWRYTWELPESGEYTILSRAVDSAGNQELTPYSISVDVDVNPPSTVSIPPGGRYFSRQRVSLTNRNDGTIYFTTNGTEPTTSSQQYSSTFVIYSTIDLKFTSEDDLGNLEPVKTESFDVTPIMEWTSQWDSDNNVYGKGVFVNMSGHAYMAGSVNNGEMVSGGEVGALDIFVKKLDIDGTDLWTAQTGTTQNDEPYDVVADSDGSVYVAGATYGSFSGYTSAGTSDVVVMKFAQGSSSPAWIKQFGTSVVDKAQGLAVSDGKVYVSGYTSGGLNGCTPLGGEDIFVVRMDTDGNVEWTGLVGSNEDDRGNDIVVDGSDIYVCGESEGALPGNSGNNFGTHAFVMKYTNYTSLGWITEFGSSTTSQEMAYGVCLDGSGNVYATGRTNGSLFGKTYNGNIDAFVVKLGASSGTVDEDWTNLIGTSDEDIPYGIYLNGNYVYIAGHTRDAFDGCTLVGETDIFVARIGTDGAVHWARQIGTTDDDLVTAIAGNQNGDICLSGTTVGSLDGNLTGSAFYNDAYVSKLDESIPPRSSISSPGVREVLQGYSTTVTGTAWNFSGTSLTGVEVSTNGGSNWYDATNTSGDWNEWSYNWTLPGADGEYTLLSRATDSLDNVEPPLVGHTVVIDNNAPSVAITSPQQYAEIAGTTYVVTGSVNDGQGSGSPFVELSTNNGSTWNKVNNSGGLRAAYYNVRDFSEEPALVRVDPTIDFSWSTGSPDPSIYADRFSVLWDGYVRCDYSETYTFYATSDDGVRVWVDGNLIIDAWYVQSSTVHTASVAMTAGIHSLRVEYYDEGSGATIKLQWESSSVAKVVIPSGNLYQPIVGSAWSYSWTLPADGNYTLVINPAIIWGNHAA